jgi:hypothetical protein
LTLGRRWAWGLAAALVAAGSLLVVAPQLPFDRAAGAADSPVTVTVTPTELLGDGQLLTVTIKTTAGFPAIAAEMQVCKHGVDFQTSAGSRPNNDFFPGGNSCPDKPVSTSANLVVTDSSVADNAATERGAVSRYRVGVGTQTWKSAVDNSDQSITCGPDAPCDLVVEVRAGPQGERATWTPVKVPLSFKDDDPIAGCGGPATGVLLSGGADRLQDAWISWTLDDCHRDGRQGGASRAVFNGEGTAVNAFATGKLDIAYSATGYGNEAGLLDEANRASPRPVIAVPVALNAAVIAVAGGRRNDTGVKVPYEDLRLTLPEVAGLLSGGSQGIQPHFGEVFPRNPELNENFFDTGSPSFLVGAPAEAESSSWFVTNHLTKNVPGDWKVPDQPAFGEDRGRTRGADAALALADPSYALSLTTLSGRPPLANAVAKVVTRNDTQGGIWVLTDLETATALGMTVVKVANVDGTFVPVNASSVTAGVKSMQETDNGLLLPNPKAVDKVDDVTPYPLAFVEYALVPAEPLVDKDCKLRSDSQALLSTWMEYVTGRGQEHLPAGMVPLTPELQQRAEQAIAQIGKAPITGDCAGAETTSTTSTTVKPAATTTTTRPATTATTTAAASTPTTAPARRRSSGSTSRSTTATTLPPPAVVVSAPPATADTVELATVPAFAGRQSVGWFGTLLALLGLTALSGLAAVIASGRALPPGLRPRRGRDAPG